MQYISVRKTIAIMIIILFFSISFIPYAYGKIGYSQFIKLGEKLDNNTISNLIIDDYNKVDFKEIQINRYNSDGSIEKSIVKIPSDQFEKFFDELKGKNSLDEKFEVYKKYNLISKDATYEQLKMDIQNNEKFLFINQNFIDKLNKVSSFYNGITPGTNMSWNLQCEVNGIMNNGMKYLIGMSAITSFINFLLWHKFQYVPSADLLDVYVVDWGKLDAFNGSMSDFHTEWGFLFIVMIGFVGYTFAYPPIPGNILVGEFYGKALFVMCQH